MDERQLTTSLEELNLATVEVPSSGFKQSDQLEHTYEDSWCDDGLKSDISDDELNREQQRRHDQFYTIGYRDGISAGKEASAQEGFNIGFKQSAGDGYKWGIVRGITSAFASLADHSKEKLVKQFEDRDKFHSLYESVQEVSSDAVKMHYIRGLQHSMQSDKESAGNFQATPSTDEYLGCSKVDLLFKELVSLVSGSSEIKSSVEASDSYRDSWEDENPATWGTSPQYQLGTPVRTYEAPTPGSGWAGTPGGQYSDSGIPRESSYGSAPSPYVPSTPTGQPMTLSSASYLPGTPGEQPMTPGHVGLDVMSPTIGGESDANWLVPDILVNVIRSGGDSHVGVVKEVLPDGSCKVALGSTGNGETLTVPPSDLDIIRPKKSDKIKILNGTLRGESGKLIGIDGSDGIVKLDGTYEVKILDMVILAKLAIK